MFNRIVQLLPLVGTLFLSTPGCGGPRSQDSKDEPEKKVTPSGERLDSLRGLVDPHQKIIDEIETVKQMGGLDRIPLDNRLAWIGGRTDDWRRDFFHQRTRGHDPGGHRARIDPPPL